MVGMAGRSDARCLVRRRGEQMSDEYDEPWSWIPHVEGADRQKEINAHLSKLLDVISLSASVREYKAWDVRMPDDVLKKITE
jgi:hypothetical protein